MTARAITLGVGTLMAGALWSSVAIARPMVAADVPDYLRNHGEQLTQV